ncbi:uncharacterized protein LOC132054193 [Lycium ferocissimum]|uniref:uncharacterized protein LOC132054193 n=1 Tax=Lycium ferocissimum TaxID=112874 RepID=UPI002815E78A|nr:uncharacterized protein LOC132054193 [Lycium ferocissimum]
MSPNKTLPQMPESGRKKGTEKIKHLVIGSIAKPRCYKHVDMDSLPHIKYFFNKKAWMTRDIFKQYMLGLNAKFENENRKILLLMDNATPHDIEECEDRLTHIKVKYKSCFIKHLIDKYERNGSHPLSNDNKFNIRQAINTLVEAWNDVKTSTILNCWRNTEILPTDVNPNVNSENLELVDDVGSVPSLIAQIPSHNTNQVMDATTCMEFDATLPILEIYTDEEIILKFTLMKRLLHK